MTIRVVRSPRRGVWRVARAPDPLAFRPPLSRDELDSPDAGNRFDSPLGQYNVLYFGTSLDVCYGETLARFRPDLGLLADIEDEWEELGFMPGGEVPRDWRQRRIAVRVRFPENPLEFPDGIRFVDVESHRTRQTLRSELADVLVYYGCTDLDVSTVRGGDRRVTRWISQWVYDQVDETGRPYFAGIRYLSRLETTWECWAVFDDVVMTELEQRSIHRTDPALRRVARMFELTVF